MGESQSAVRAEVLECLKLSGRRQRFKGLEDLCVECLLLCFY